MENPLVSVIVPTKNSSKFLEECLLSIKNQSYKNIELIVVDNNSTDSTKEIAGKYTDLVFNYGPERSAQVNYGVRKASGEYVYKVDSDFILDKDVVAQCVERAQEGYDAVVVHNTPDEKVSWIARIRKFEVDMYKYDLTHSSARFVRKEVYGKIGGFNAQITAGEDYDFQNKLNRGNFKTGFVGAEATHLGEPTDFFSHMKKYYEYGKDFVNYKSENALESKTQMRFFRQIYFKNWKKFLRHPLSGIKFLIYNLFKFGFGFFGYLNAKLRKKKHDFGVIAEIAQEPSRENNPRVSIILSIKSFSNRLERVFNSISRQTCETFETIIVSAEKEAKIEELSKKYSFVFSFSPFGKTFSRNFGADRASGEFLFFIDDDMLLSPNLLEECLKMAKEQNYKALAIPEREERMWNFFNKVSRLEKTIASSDKYIEAPRFIEKNLYKEVGGMDVRLDPIDEGDLKAKLEEHKIPYATVESEIEIVSDSRNSSILKRWKRVFRRGKKMPLFNGLHPESKQLRPAKRVEFYFKNFKLLFKNPISGFALVVLKAMDLLMLKTGAFFCSKEDRILIAKLKNERIFENESESYQKEFYENTIGGSFVDKEEKKTVASYFENFDRNSEIKILDIGPGGGRWSELILENFPKSKVAAVDLSSGMVQNLKNKFRKFGERFSAVEADMQKLPFSEDEFDLVISIRAIKYSMDQDKVFSEIRRVLKPGRNAIIELPYFNFVYKVIRSLKIFGKLSEYANRINLKKRKKIMSSLKERGFIINDYKIVFSLPATLYKNIKSRKFLSALKILDLILPKSVLGRSLFVSIKKPAMARVLDEDLEKLISVVIVNWNGKKWLAKCFDSLLVQTYKNIEIVLVDNGSTDGSVSYVRENYPQIRIVESERNLGFAGGNNLGIKHANGEYILLLNNDTWLEKDFILTLYQNLVSQNLDVIAPKEKNYEGSDSDFSEDRTIDILGHPFFDKELVKDKGFYLQGICLLFRKDLYEDTLGLDDGFFMYFEETDWFWRLNLLERKFAVDKTIAVNHAGGGTAGKGLQYRTFLWRNQNCLQMLLKNYVWNSLIWVLPIYFIQNLFEIMFFVVILKPKIAFSYIEGWIFNFRNLKNILKKRRWVQNNRIASDNEIRMRMYHGLGKVHHFKDYIRRFLLK